MLFEKRKIRSRRSLRFVTEKPYEGVYAVLIYKQTFFVEEVV